MVACCSMKIYHVVNVYEAKNPEDQKRNAFARKSWEKLYKRGVIPLHITDAEFSRSSKDIGDTRPVPYVKDVIAKAVAKAKGIKSTDAILVTNMDTILHEGIISDIIKKPIFYGCRRELEADRTKLLSKAQIDKLVLAHSSSADVFKFTFGWWKKHKDKYPDMLLGCQWWDTTMIDLMEALKKEKDIRVIHNIYHRNHKPFWFSEETMFKNPGQKHNRELARGWSNPNKDTKFAEVVAWEKHLEAKFNSTLGKNHIKIGTTTYVF